MWNFDLTQAVKFGKPIWKGFVDFILTLAVFIDGSAQLDSDSASRQGRFGREEEIPDMTRNYVKGLQH